MPLENWPRPIRNLLLWLLGIQWAHKLLDELSADKPAKHELLNRIFQRNGFDIKTVGEDKIPKGESCLFASNHPHGLIDGLAAIWLGCKNGHDCRAVGRHFLSVFEPIRDWFLLVKVDGNRQAHAAKKIVEQSINFLKDGGSLVITPAARVSVSRPLWHPARDLPWKPGVIKLHESAEVPIVLIHIEVPHSVVRQLAQSIHGVVRALLQVWGYRFGRSQKLIITVLDVVYPGDIPVGTAKERIKWLQARFDGLVSENLQQVRG